MKMTLFILIMSIFVSCGASIEIVPGSNDDNRSESRADGSFPGVTVNNYEKEIFLLVNDHRSKLGKNKLKWHDKGIIESQDHSQDMASFRVPFGHLGYDARMARIKAVDSQVVATGENVAQNSTAKKAFNAWLTSYGHRKNIEGDYTHTGIGAKKSADGNWYFTQIFLKK
jgi:uncharacterized protein YkwD